MSEPMNQATESGLAASTCSAFSDTPETNEAWNAYDRRDAGLHWVSEQMRKLERERDRNSRIIDHIMDVGVYPKSIVGGPIAYEQRSEWQEGWNAATTEMIRRYEESSRPGFVPQNARAMPPATEQSNGK